MIRVVIDTNVVISANLVDEGPSAAILSLAIDKKILMLVSAPVLAEYEKVLYRPRLNLNPNRIEAFLAVIRAISGLVTPTRAVDAIQEDEPDNRFLECAEAANADYLITGNTRHFPAQFGNTRIVTPRDFLDLIVPQLAQGDR